MPSLAYNTFLFYFLIAAVQGIILSSLIIFQKPKRQTNAYFGWLIFLFSLSILHGVLEDSIHVFNAKFPFPMNYGMLCGPLAFFHMKSLIVPSFKFHKRLLLQFVPSFLFDFLFTIILYTYVGSNMDWAYENIVLIRFLAFAQGMLVLVHIVIYSIAIYRVVQKADFTHDSQIKSLKKWVNSFVVLWSIGLLLMLGLSPVIYLSMDREDYGYSLFFPLGIFDSLFIYWLGYSYLLKYRSVVQLRLNRAERTKFSKGELVKKKEELIEALTFNDLFRDPHLNVEKLAEKLGWPSRELSMIINEVFETNFNELVNKCRVDSFLTLMMRPESQKYSIDGLAKDVGFNSKASFYRAFKKVTGQTPSEFLSTTPK